MKYERLSRPAFTNPTTIRCQGVLADGTLEEVDIQVPPNDAVGVNEYFDFILETYNIADIRAAYDVALKRHRAQQAAERDKAKREIENKRLEVLFNSKAKIFEMPFIAESAAEVRSAVRRAPNLEILNIIVNDSFRAYLEANEMTYSDYLDHLDELAYEQQSETEQ